MVARELAREPITVMEDQHTKPVTLARVHRAVELHPRVLTMRQVEMTVRASGFHLRVVEHMHHTVHLVFAEGTFNKHSPRLIEEDAAAMTLPVDDFTNVVATIAVGDGTAHDNWFPLDLFVERGLHAALQQVIVDSLDDGVIWQVALVAPIENVIVGLLLLLITSAHFGTVGFNAVLGMEEQFRASDTLKRASHLEDVILLLARTGEPLPPEHVT
jgi:hypothetical protein